MSVAYQLVEWLADGRFQSGEVLGQRLGVTRAAVWKQLRDLERLGLSVQAVRGKGYRLAHPVELLEPEAIRAALSPAVRQSLANIEYFHELDSTNDHLRARGEPPSGTVCLAERQTRGRGRRGRNWVSPYGANLYLSLAWRFEPGLAALGGLSLVVGIALLRALHGLGVEGAGLKWPNDVYLQGRKLAGILVEVSGESAGPCSTVIGIGINVAMPEHQGRQIDQQWTDLRAGGIPVSRNQLATAVLEQLFPVLEEFIQHGLQPFRAEWQRHDLSYGEPVRIHLAESTLAGRGQGIDQDGAFLLETPDGIRRFTSGEVSLRIAS
jgi:BirA family transcriptional regulator, biotin operon repressor / biotin---[acetyl-CoA-carboxylase] ligase